MNTATNPYAHLMLEFLTPDDAGEYACRLSLFFSLIQMNRAVGRGKSSFGQ
ncbi:hypothetical protein QR98_0098270 [Sarcoptes scabiei]|uniref:Uncharacterized protein n=1 Tax=Sarcoptes scabiei TaxID=52283 RepID=A0A132AK00_SARSC|nr:hypothetical protein QR98_0098270 [Sarcoptes scabiei]